ncbi:MAG TPA: anti-sigma factor antagonist [Streptosporangiaceae bacterium]|jgi:anti-sigma B factor antagonist
MTVPILERAPSPPLPGREHGDVTVISLRGELDALDAPALQASLSEIRGQGQPRSVIDLTALAFIDCACLGALARHAREIQARGGTLALAGPHGAVRRLLSVTGLLTWFDVHDTVSQATSSRGCRSLVFPATR